MELNKSIDGNKYLKFTQFLINDEGETESTANGTANIIPHIRCQLEQ